MSRRAWVAFAVMAVVWGLPYLFMRVAVSEVSPVFVAWSRLTIAAVLLLPLAASRGVLASARGKLPWIVLLAAFYMALAFTMLPLAETVLPSSLSAIVIAGVPIVVTLLGLRSERPSATRVAGLALGFAGVGALVGFDIGVRPAQLLALGALAVVLVSYAFGPLLTRSRLQTVHPLAVSGLTSGTASLLLTPALLFQLPRHVPSEPVLLSLLGLGVLCSVVAFVTWFFLIQEAGPARATVVPYVNPVVGVVAGALVLHERIGPGAVVGMALILAGSWLATTGRTLRFRALRALSV
ncbi:MAG TPA: EamA family transporter [Candidatus Dormibacteraeota bacterium]